MPREVEPRHPLLPAAGTLRTLRSSLRRWHLANGRDLPWRGCGDPYQVWVSEIMLQQTTVAAVRPYFERFLKRFPTVQHLASSDESEVLRLWEGLGYYSRARNLHRAAQEIVEQHDGRLPRTVDALQSLPGVGRYTAGAIASFGMRIPAPILEANTLRLYTRWLGFDGDPRSTAGQRLLWSFAEVLVPDEHPGEFNQALIDLGATVCTPTQPRCDACPLPHVCRAFQTSRQHELPRPKRRPRVTQLTEIATVVHKAGAVLLRQCQPGERWAGLWDFPRIEVARSEPVEIEPRSSTGSPGRGRTDSRPATSLDGRWLAEARQHLRARTGVDCEPGELLLELTHTVTRYQIRLLVIAAAPVGGRIDRGDAPCRWVRPQALAAVPLSTTGRKIARHLLAGRD
ncbi:MAG: A/G-specific adenine glycosylase [Planctomycetaceae bacterium]